MNFKLKKDFTIDFKHYGEITIPKGTMLTNTTAVGNDLDYFFVNQFDWIAKDYPDISSILKMDMENGGLNVPIEEVDITLEERKLICKLRSLIKAKQKGLSLSTEFPLSESNVVYLNSGKFGKYPKVSKEIYEYLQNHLIHVVFY